MTGTEQGELCIPVPPHFLDHAFEGRAILPAVEILEILAGFVHGRCPEIPVRTMEDALFPRFLVLDPGADALVARIEWQSLDDGRVKALLGTAVRSRSGAIGRLAVHGSVVFGAGTVAETLAVVDRKPVRTDRFGVPAERLYRDLIPFGPAYRNARDPIEIWEEGAEAVVQAPDWGNPRRLLGSPFPLDAGLHVACAWCQRYGGTVALPLGFRNRRIVRPIAPGESCRVRIDAKGETAGSFLFDLRIRDSGNGVLESLSGVRMRDVSRGRLRPPSWIRAGRDGCSREPAQENGKPPA